MKNLHIQENIQLSVYTTMRLGGTARYFAVVSNQSEMLSALQFAQEKDIPVLPLGGGSNILVSDVLHDVCVLKIENKDLTIVSENEKTVTVRVSAGYIWDDFVQWSVDHSLSGIEALSAIPGTCGATPVQNVGAYGTEVSSVIESVWVYDTVSFKLKNISGDQCKFSYRDSIFKTTLKGKNIIESVVYTLSKAPANVPDYPLVSTVLTEYQNKNPGAPHGVAIRNTIQKIRRDKLPDPKIISNVGSFFKNPIVDAMCLKKMLDVFPRAPYFIVGDAYKVPAGWLIETSGFKGFSNTRVGVYEKNALVLVNYTAVSLGDVLQLAESIQMAVWNMFGIQLEIEPEIIV